MGAVPATHADQHEHDGHDHDDDRGSGHDHDHAGHGHGHGIDLRTAADPARARRALVIALVLTLTFALVEATVGFWKGSISLVGDSAHMLGDALALAGSVFVASLALRPRSFQNTFGFRRAEVLAAVGNAALLAMGSLWVVREAIERLGAPHHVEGSALFVTAAVGLGVNLIAAIVLSRAGSGSLNVRAAFFHVLGDALGSLAVLIAGVLVAVAGWRLADPVAAIVIALLLAYGAFRLLRESAHVLMEGVPPHVDTRALEKTIRETPGVASVHDLHVWAITPDTPMLTAHVVLAPGPHGTDVAHLVGERLAAKHGITHSTIQPESGEPALASIRPKR